MEPSRSSSTAFAQGAPALVTRRFTEDRIPASVTDRGSSPPRAADVAIDSSAALARMCSSPNSGWSQT